MKFQRIDENKKQYLDLLLLADEQENMIDAYLERGTMYASVLENGETVAVCIVTDEKDGVLEIKNISVQPKYQRMGYGKAMIECIIHKYKNQYQMIQVGTGEIPWIISFYETCGFRQSHKRENFFLDNYDHPMYECGIQLIDMIYLTVKL